jgi:hypothetical protein
LIWWTSAVLFICALIVQGDWFWAAIYMYQGYRFRDTASLNIPGVLVVYGVIFSLWGGLGVVDSFGMLGRYGPRIYLSLAFSGVIAAVVMSIIGLNRLKDDPQYRSQLS